MLAGQLLIDPHIGLKTCRDCRAALDPIAGFYAVPAQPCRQCVLARGKRLRRANYAAHRAYEQDPSRAEARRLNNRKACVTRRKDPRHRQRLRARDAVSKAILAGKLVRATKCERCDTAALTHGHHDDYAKPLAVRWLCALCHVVVHHGDPPT